MIERPALFKGEMVRAILDGRKTQTRRIVKAVLDHADCNHPPSFFDTGDNEWACRHCGHGYCERVRCPYGKPGDRLWVRETFSLDRPDGKTVFYRADGHEYGREGGWKPSIFMPRWASRITLEVTSVRVERLQSISEGDAKAEGAPDYEEGEDAPPPDTGCEWSYRAAYARLWNSINGAGAWDANPFVWVVSFKRVSQ